MVSPSVPLRRAHAATHPWSGPLEA